MSLTIEQKKQISDFTDRREFVEKGGLMTDLDGTVIQEHEGKYFMPDLVREGLVKMYNAQCPVIINTMRFPISVIKTFATDWFVMSKASVPLVSLNGSQIGFINKDKKSKFTFQEIEAFPLKKEEVKKFISDIEQILEQGGSVLVFYYPRDWVKGEIIWTSDKEKTSETKDRYRSASHVYNSNMEELTRNLESEDICMIFLKAIQSDPATPFTNTDYKDFYSHQNVDKLFGAKKMISHLEREIHQFVGAGDTPMDVFLKEVGQVIKVGGLNMNFEFNSPVIELKHVPDIGEVFTEVAGSCAGSESLLNS
ncbi:HAD hydrolase family protein [Dyadobacter sp. NIV53]|uniref:HAD hydrolase family protein n=1 Tax=Dyadobacter sp. NIV53 TaxID=2861765 RepID=UPI001C88C6E6|nr:HAD hydrolase family protein [Dyadobacter sp. NIV53]